jgi:hypothetical protein
MALGVFISSQRNRRLTHLSGVFIQIRWEPIFFLKASCTKIHSYHSVRNPGTTASQERYHGPPINQKYYYSSGRREDLHLVSETSSRSPEGVWIFATQNVEPRLVAFGRRGGTIPAVLHACRLSRSGAAPTYTFLKYCEYHKEGFNIPINFEDDVVFLRKDSSYGDLRGYFPDLQLEVKRLAVSPESDQTLILNLEYEQSADMLEILTRAQGKWEETMI